MKKKSNLIRQQDIADALGVSLNTVSHALRDCNDISKETIAKVKAKAQELGYISNNIAYYLVNGKTNFVAIIFPSLQNPYYLIMITYLLNDLKERHLDGLLIPVDSVVDRQMVEKVMLNRCGGVITFVEPEQNVARIFEERSIPVILLGSNSPFASVDSVYTDDGDGGRQVGEVFLSSECEKALYIGNAFTETSRRRAEGFLQSIEGRKKAETYFLTLEEYGRFDAMYDFIEKGKFDFIFTHNDELAITIRRHFNFPVGGKVKLFGYDDVSGYLNVCERVNSVSSSYEEIARYTADLMKKRFDGEESDRPHRKVFPVKVVFHE